MKLVKLYLGTVSAAALVCLLILIWHDTPKCGELTCKAIQSMLGTVAVLAAVECLKVKDGDKLSDITERRE